LFATKVKKVSPFTAKASRTDADIEFDPPVPSPPGTPPGQVRVRTSTTTAFLTKSPPDASPSASLFTDPAGITALLDSTYRQIKLDDPMIFAVEANSVYTAARVSLVLEAFVFQRIPRAVSPTEVRTAARIPVTRVSFDRALAPLSSPSQVSFHFGFVEA